MVITAAPATMTPETTAPSRTAPACGEARPSTTTAVPATPMPATTAITTAPACPEARPLSTARASAGAAPWCRRLQQQQVQLHSHRGLHRRVRRTGHDRQPTQRDPPPPRQIFKHLAIVRSIHIGGREASSNRVRCTVASWGFARNHVRRRRRDFQRARFSILFMKALPQQ